MGTSEQLPISSTDYKRVTSLHKDGKRDPVIILDSKWKTKAQVQPELCPARMQTTKERLFMPPTSSAVANAPKKEEGCMPKVKLERTLKLDKEDRRQKTYNILSGATVEASQWGGPQ